MWCIPPDANPEFVWKMEDVLRGLQTSVRSASTRRLYGRDEQATHRRDAAACGSGTGPAAPCGLRIQAQRGSGPLHVLRAAARWRRVWITPQRRKVEWAWCVKQLLDENYPQAERLVLVCDNLNTHTGGALYEAFPAAEARRLWERLEVHYTPKHGSWLNMAETELSVLAGQCLDRRIDEVAVLRSEVGPWEDHRNRTEAKVHGGSRRRTPGSSWRNCIRCSSTPILMDFRSRRTYQKSSDSRRVRLIRDK